MLCNNGKPIVIICLVLTVLMFYVVLDNQSYKITTKENAPAANFKDRNKLLEVLAKVSSIPPPVSPNKMCRPPPLPKIPSCMNETGLNGETLDTPRKLAVMLLFSFEADTLEIAFHELIDIVDVIFLVEATKTHKGAPKPLMWERIKFSKRFKFVNQSKVIHIITDNIVDSEKSKSVMWYAEKLQTQIAISQIKEWNKNTGKLCSDDLFISADVDEVMSRPALHKLKWCQTAGHLISGSLWMPLGNLNRALKSDFPVVGKPHTYGLPTIYKWETINSGQYDGSRLQVYFPSVARGPRDRYVSGGLHMTSNAFLPTSMLKELTATESRGYVSDEFLETVTLEDLQVEQEDLYKLVNKKFWLNRTDFIDTVTDVQKYIPWFLECNPERFPYWYGNLDPRNVQLLKALKSPQNCKL